MSEIVTTSSRIDYSFYDRIVDEIESKDAEGDEQIKSIKNEFSTEVPLLHKLPSKDIQ